MQLYYHVAKSIALAMLFYFTTCFACFVMDISTVPCFCVCVCVCFFFFPVVSSDRDISEIEQKHNHAQQQPRKRKVCCDGCVLVI